LYVHNQCPQLRQKIILKIDSRLRLDVKVNLRKVKLFYMEDDGRGLWSSPVHKDLK
jgi:hypothetical protein